MLSRLGEINYVKIFNNDLDTIKEKMHSMNENELCEFTMFLKYYSRLNSTSNSDKTKASKIVSFTLNEADMALRPSINLSLDNDGNILLTKRENVDYGTIYANSHSLLKIYDETNNIEGMKYELCKQWMCKTLIDNRIIYNKSITSKFISANKLKEAKSVKSFIMSDIKTYLKKIVEKEPSFNFQEYFNKTQFGIEVYKIDNRLLKAIKNFI